MIKTPISILQELMVKTRGPLPQYELLPSEGIGTHFPTFHYRVTIHRIIAEGKARSKKEAKHEAAKNALQKLCSFDFHHPAHVSTPPVVSPYISPLLGISTLQKFCTENGIPQPKFQLKTVIGPAHLRHFTYECKIATITATATKLTKKKAKQLTAQLMLHCLMHTSPEVIVELKVNEVPAIQSSKKIRASYNEMSSTNKERVNGSLKISAYPHSVRNIMKEKNLTKEILWQDINNMDETDLTTILSKLNLQYKMNVVGIEGNTIVFIKVFISINSQPELSIVQIAEVKEEAIFRAIHNCFELLKIMTNCEEGSFSSTATLTPQVSLTPPVTMSEFGTEVVTCSATNSPGVSECSGNGERETTPEAPPPPMNLAWPRNFSNVRLTNDCYSPAVSIISTATIRSKEKRNRKRLLAGPCSEFSFASTGADLEFDYYDYNVVNAATVPGSYLGMDPQYLVWIPPLDESGEILQNLKRIPFEYEDIRRKQSLEQEILISKPRRRSRSEGSSKRSTLVLSTKIHPLTFDVSNGEELSPILKRLNPSRCSIPLHEFPKRLRLNRSSGKETRGEKSPSVQSYT